MKLFFRITLYALSLLLLLSCTKRDKIDEETPVPPSVSKEVTLNLAFPSKSPSSKSIFDTKEKAWEESLSSISCYIVKTGSLHLVSSHKFTKEEIELGSATFVIDEFTPDVSYKFYVLGNGEFEINNLTELDTLLSSDISSYNGDFQSVSRGSLRDGGFLFSGSSEVVAKGESSTLTLDVSISRLVCKYAVKASVSPKFSQKYPGSTLQIRSIIISQSSERSPVFKRDTLLSEYLGYRSAQTPSLINNEHHSLFYLFENGSRIPFNQVRLNILATYDPDGDPRTTSDIEELSYTIPISKNDGVLLRNIFYQHKIIINGLVGGEVSSTFEIKPWNSKDNPTDLG